jgi:hypothetical protein
VMDLDDRAADPAGLGVPAHVIADGISGHANLLTPTMRRARIRLRGRA